MTTQYKKFITLIKAEKFPAKQIFTDSLTTFAYSTDASFYRLVPKVVLKINSKEEAALIIQIANSLRIGLTFRAAGTSLSGQSSSNKVLVVLGTGFRNFSISKNAKTVTLEPALIGGRVNKKLAVYGRKLGPDPASIDSAMIGGIVANNSSGMCCGVAQNSYHTLVSLKAILADGSYINTANFIVNKKKSYAQLSNLGKSIFTQLAAFSADVKNNKKLVNRIQRKFSIKNTTGYSLNALVDYSDPHQIFQHLLVGSEGTLGFISEVTLNTVVQNAHRAVGLFIFKTAKQACLAVEALTSVASVAVVELMDSVSLISVSEKPNLPDFLKKCDGQHCGLLVEVNSMSAIKMKNGKVAANKIINRFQPVFKKDFSSEIANINLLWKIRKELFPTVGTIRKLGTCVIIEDIVFPIKYLAKGVVQLRNILNKFSFQDAIIFGHALAGNLHFVFSQDYSNKNEIKRYANMMDAVCHLVLSLDGSLKGEHGTGRNMAAYVEKEWGSDAYKIMTSIKNIFDENNIFNADVIFSADKNIHLKNFKTMAVVDPLIDKCTECGYCEAVCPSANYTLTPRQRIAVVREIARKKKNSTTIMQLLRNFIFKADFKKFSFNNMVLNTCAADGMCSLACPVNINTGSYVKHLRTKNTNFISNYIVKKIATHYRWFLAAGKVSLYFAKLPKLFFRNFAFVRSLPQPASVKVVKNKYIVRNKIVFLLPSCIGRMANVSANEINAFPTRQQSISSVVTKVLANAGFAVEYLNGFKNQCCGLAFSSKGHSRTAAYKKEEVLEQLKKSCKKNNAIFDGNPIVLSDLASCSEEWSNFFVDKPIDFYDAVEFIANELLPIFKKKYGHAFRPLKAKVAVFVPCSARKMNIEKALVDIALFACKEVQLVENIACCGFAGDKGFKNPALNKSALLGLQEQIQTCNFGVSSSITCQIGLTRNSSLAFISVVTLLNMALEKNEKIAAKTSAHLLV